MKTICHLPNLQATPNQNSYNTCFFCSGSVAQQTRQTHFANIAACHQTQLDDLLLHCILFSYQRLPKIDITWIIQSRDQIALYITYKTLGVKNFYSVAFQQLHTSVKSNAFLIFTEHAEHNQNKFQVVAKKKQHQHKVKISVELTLCGTLSEIGHLQQVQLQIWLFAANTNITKKQNYKR